MALYRLTGEAIELLTETSFANLGVKERADLQRLLKANISAVADDVLIIAEEFCQWDDSRRRIDLLGIDRSAKLVVFELKRNDDGGHMELQAIRYAAMVSTITFDRACEVYEDFLAVSGAAQSDARTRLLDFLGWSEVREDLFGQDVRIILVSADFSKELTTTVLWLNERELDIKCVRLKPYELRGETVLDVQQVVPLPEAEAYQVRVREKAVGRREALRHGDGAPTGYWFMNIGDHEGANKHRVWDECRKYGYMLAGGGKQWIDQVKRLTPGSLLFAYASGSGYVGLGEVVSEAVPEKDFIPPGQLKRLVDLPRQAAPHPQINDPDASDWCVGVRWIHTRDRDQGLLRTFARRSTVEQIRRQEVVDKLLKAFEADPI